MKTEFLKLMKCPYCGSGFKVGMICRGVNEEIFEGIVACDCNEYPIIEGILILKINALSSYLLELLKEGKLDLAIEYAVSNTGEIACEFSNFFKHKGVLGIYFMKFISLFIEQGIIYNYKKYFEKSNCFSELIGNSEYNIYLKNRFSAESLWSIYPFISLLRENYECILDLSCGMGHSSFILSTYVRPRCLVCADYFFNQLYINKKYFAPDAIFICLDANYLLPFKDETFSSILMLDAFHYILERSSLAREMDRVTSSKGLLLLLHLHNLLNHNVGHGWALSPCGWLNLFQNMPVKILPERTLIEDYLYKDKLELTKEYSAEDLNSSNALAIIYLKDKSLLNDYTNLWRYYLYNKSNLVINPLYEIRQNDDQYFLQRMPASESFCNEFPIKENYLPKNYIIDGDIADIICEGAINSKDIVSSEKNIQYLNDLMKKFVVINVPKSYL